MKALFSGYGSLFLRLICPLIEKGGLLLGDGPFLPEMRLCLAGNHRRLFEFEESGHLLKEILPHLTYFL